MGPTIRDLKEAQCAYERTAFDRELENKARLTPPKEGGLSKALFRLKFECMTYAAGLWRAFHG